MAKSVSTLTFQELSKYTIDFFCNTDKQTNAFQEVMKSYITKFKDSEGKTPHDLFLTMIRDANFFKEKAKQTIESNPDSSVAYKAIETLINVVTMFYMSKLLKKSSTDSIMSKAADTIRSSINDNIKTFGEYVNSVFPKHEEENHETILTNGLHEIDTSSVKIDLELDA